MTESDEPEVLTVREAAAVLRLSPQVIYRKIERGEIPTLKLGRTKRIPRRAIEEMLRAS